MLNKNTALLVVGLLSGCSDLALSFRQNEVSSVQQAGETHIGLLAVEPWDNVVREITPDFGLTEAGALEAALPRVSALEEKLLNVFAAKLGIGLPEIAKTVTKTTNLADGAITGDRTVNKSSGELPGADVLPTINTRKSSDLPGLPQAARDDVVNNNDSMLRFQAASALYQYVQVLQRLIRTTPQYEGYTPYLATFQITSSPHTRHQPYDLYLNMSFYPTRGQLPPVLVPLKDVVVPVSATAEPKTRHFTKLPVVVPVMITDNVEVQNVSRAAELIRQFSLSAQGLIGGVAAALGINSQSDRSAAVFGTDLTSTFTVGRTAQNGLTAILGAPRNPVSDFAMVRRTHNVSVLIMVPNEIAKAPHQFLNARNLDGTLTAKNDLTACKAGEFEKCIERRLFVLFNTELRRPDQIGNALPLQASSDENSLRRLKKFISQNGAQTIFDPKAAPGKCGSDEWVSSLLRVVPQADYGKFNDMLIGCFSDYETVEFLYHGLIDIYGSSPGPRSTTIVLPELKQEKPKEQRALTIASASARISAFDNGVNEMVVEAAGVFGKLPKGTVAILQLRTPATFVPVIASEVGVKNGKLVARFQSAKALGIGKVRTTGSQLMLRYVKDDVWKSSTFTRVVYSVQTAAKPAAAQQKSEMTVSVKPDGTTTVTAPVKDKKS